MFTRQESINRCINAIASLAKRPLATKTNPDDVPDTYNLRAALIMKLAKGLHYLDTLTDEQYTDALAEQLTASSPYEWLTEQLADPHTN